MKSILKIIPFFLFVLFPVVLIAQVIKPIPVSSADSSIIKKDTIISVTEQKDISDVISSVFKKRASKQEKEEKTSTGSAFSVVPAIGYSLQTRLAAVLAGNVAFYTHKESKLSVLSGHATYTQNKQFYMPVQLNVWTKGNKYNLVGEYRYYKYPQSTFGLGSNAPIENEDPMDYSFLRFYQIVYKKAIGEVYGGLGYIIDYRWNVSHEGPKNGAASDYEMYGQRSKSIATGLTANALYDTRDNLLNATRGFYTSLQLRKNLKALGSNSTWSSLIIDIRKYLKPNKSSPNVLALWSYNWLILNGKPAYLDLPSNGWDAYNATGRGYIQGRYRGMQMVYMEAEYRYRITANGLFGGVVFANAQSFSAGPGTGLQAIKPAAGAGLRLKISKESQTNIGIDFGFGTEGSKGLFITVGENF